MKGKRLSHFLFMLGAAIHNNILQEAKFQSIFGTSISMDHGSEDP